MGNEIDNDDAKRIRDIALSIKSEFPYESLYLLSLARRARPYGKSIKAAINGIKDELKEVSGRVRDEFYRDIDKEYIKGGSPNKIWFYWRQGIDKSPEVVKLSLKTWVEKNPNYDVVILNEDNVSSYIGFDVEEYLKFSSVSLGEAGKSDLIRLILLYKYGGVWADATTFCIESLDLWLNLKDEVFYFRQKSKNKDRYLVSWFLFSQKRSSFIKGLLDLAFDYLFTYREGKLTLTHNLDHSNIAAQKKKYKNSGFELLSDLESKSYAPYFWLFYLFNENLKSFKGIDEVVSKRENKHVQFNAPFEAFKSCYVSKQTYKREYIGSEVYKKRVEYLK